MSAGLGQGAFGATAGFGMSAGLGQPSKGTGAPAYRDTQERESTSGPGGQVHTYACMHACMHVLMYKNHAINPHG